MAGRAATARRGLSRAWPTRRRVRGTVRWTGRLPPRVPSRRDVWWHSSVRDSRRIRAGVTPAQETVGARKDSDVVEGGRPTTSSRTSAAPRFPRRGRRVTAADGRLPAVGRGTVFGGGLTPHQAPREAQADSQAQVRVENRVNGLASPAEPRRGSLKMTVGPCGECVVSACAHGSVRWERATRSAPSPACTAAEPRARRCCRRLAGSSPRWPRACGRWPARTRSGCGGGWSSSRPRA